MSKKTKTSNSARPWRDTSVFAGGPGQKWTGIASILAVIFVMGVAVLVLLFPAGDPIPPAGGDPNAAPGGRAVDDDAFRCPDVGLSSREATPDDLEWTSQHGMSWPVSPSAGPRAEVDGVRVCFDRSPIGAALAAVGAVQAARSADADTLPRVFSHQFIDNPGRAIAQEGAADLLAEQPLGTRPWPRQMGFKVTAFLPGEVQLLLVEDVGGRQFIGTWVTVVWEDGDWKVRLQADGQLAGTPQTITVDPDGFTRWEALP